MSESDLETASVEGGTALPAPSSGFPLRVFLRVLRRRIPLFSIAFAVLFTVIAYVQYLVIRREIYTSAEEQLSQWASRVVDLIGYKDRWDLNEYRRSADIEAPSVYVFTTEGRILETKGFIPGLITQVKLPDPTIVGEVRTIKTETGEAWRMLARKIRGGVVVVGILNFSSLKAPDELLKTTAEQFGSSIEEALKLRSGQTASEVDYAIIDDSGRLRFAAEGLPLIVDAKLVADMAKSRGPMKIDGKWFLLFSRPIFDVHGKVVGKVAVPKDVSGEENVLHKQVRFNILLAAVSWAAALLLVTAYLAWEEWRRRPQAATLEEALKDGESQTVEFKRGLADEHLAAAIAAFANTNNGTVFLGIDDKCQVLGVDCDSPVKKDGALKRVREIITQVIKPAVSVSADFLRHEGKVVLRVFVPRGDQLLYFLHHEIYVREQTSSMRATPEQVERIIAKFYG